MDNRARVSADLERTTKPSRAVNTILGVAEELGFQVNCSTVGSKLNTTTCELKRSDGSSAIGRGKGVGIQSVASAIFEAFEHYHHKYEDTVSRIVSRSFDFSGSELRYASPDFGLIFGERTVPLACLHFRSISKQSSIRFPAILMNPAFESANLEERQLIDSTRIYRYATNSGTAAGLTVEEAVLHGLLEVIERDSIGITLVEAVLSPAPVPIRVIDLCSLPEGVSKIVDSVIEETGCHVKLWNITSDLQVPAVLCSLTVGSPPVHCFFGSGASLFAEYAVERALLEALQGYHIQMALGVALQPKITRNVERMSLFQRCQLDAGYFAYRGGEAMTDFSEFDDAVSVNNNSGAVLLYDVVRQMNFLIETLFAKDVKSYYRIIYNGTIYVTQVIVPRLERLYLLMHGLPIAPSSRGRAFKRTASGTQVAGMRLQ